MGGILLFSQLAALGGVLCETDLQIPVPAAKRVDERLLIPGAAEHDIIGEPVKTAETGGFDAHETTALGIGLKNVVKRPGVFERLRHGDVHRPVLIAVFLLTEARAGEHRIDKADEKREHRRDRDAAHTAGKAGRH